MSYKIENLTRQEVLILLNNNSLIALEPEQAVASLPLEEIRDNFVVQQLETWGLIAVRKIETAWLTMPAAANP